jgi:hypothetical protein
MIRHFVLLGFIALSIQLFGQSGSITGVVKDSTNNQTLEYATIMCYSSKNNEAVTGTTTNKNGLFKIAPVDTGEYYLLLSFIGYKQKRIDGVVIKTDQFKLNLNTVYLQLTEAILKEVMIDGSMPSIDYRLDKKVITVSKQIGAQSGSAIDILENVSSVQVDINGNVRLRGGTGISVLIDGKPTLLSASEALRQIPAKTIESIEIITNPSAKFDAEGSAGIINVILRKDRLEGINTYLNFTVGSFGRIGGNFLIKYKQKKYKIYLGTDYIQRDSPGITNRNRTTFDNDSTFNTTASGNYSAERKYGNVRTGIEFNFDKQDIFSLELKYQKWNTLYTSKLNVEERVMPSDSIRFNTNFENRSTFGDIYTLKSFYKRLFAKKGHQIKATFSYDYQYGEDNPINELKSSDGNITDGKKNFETGTASLYRLKVDYDLPLGENSNFGAGLQSRFEVYHDNTSFQDYYPDDNEYVVQDDFTQQTDYLRNIHSFYAMFGSEVNRFEYQFGIRGEFTDRNIENTNHNEPFTFNKMDFFPTLHLAYDFQKKNQLYASYGRRIDRPRSSMLEPFFTWEDAFNIKRGNPELIPEYIDSYELGYIKKFNKNLFAFESYYRVSRNKIEDIFGVFEENILFNTPVNVGQDFTLGFEVSLSYRLFKWWDFDLMGTFYNYRVEGKVSGFDFSNQTNSWNSRFNNTFNIYKGIKIQINSLYNGPVVDAQGRFEGYYRLNAAIKTSLWDNQVSVVLEFRDVFSSVKNKYTGEGPRFYSNFESQREAPQIRFSISYLFDKQ